MGGDDAAAAASAAAADPPPLAPRRRPLRVSSTGLRRAQPPLRRRNGGVRGVRGGGIRGAVRRAARSPARQVLESLVLPSQVEDLQVLRADPLGLHRHARWLHADDAAVAAGKGAPPVALRHHFIGGLHRRHAPRDPSHLLQVRRRRRRRRLLQLAPLRVGRNAASGGGRPRVVEPVHGAVHRAVHGTAGCRRRAAVAAAAPVRPRVVRVVDVARLGAVHAAARRRVAVRAEGGSVQPGLRLARALLRHRTVAFAAAQTAVVAAVGTVVVLVVAARSAAAVAQGEAFTARTRRRRPVADDARLRDVQQICTRLEQALHAEHLPVDLRKLLGAPDLVSLQQVATVVELPPLARRRRLVAAAAAAAAAATLLPAGAGAAPAAAAAAAETARNARGGDGGGAPGVVAVACARCALGGRRALGQGRRRRDPLRDGGGGGGCLGGLRPLRAHGGRVHVCAAPRADGGRVTDVGGCERGPRGLARCACRQGRRDRRCGAGGGGRLVGRATLTQLGGVAAERPYAGGLLLLSCWHRQKRRRHLGQAAACDLMMRGRDNTVNI
eukprot:Rhum_TRINITY_DN14720_c4_g1::Rhum_TRINITY_DN14720_c4_g1_i1::g.111423::m.111423